METKKRKTSHLEDERIDDDSVLSEEEIIEENIFDSFPKGLLKGYHIVSHATVPPAGFSMDQLAAKLKEDEIKRLHLTQTNVTTPVALMLLFPEEFGTLTRARKECRRSKIIVLRHSADKGVVEVEESVDFKPEKMSIGKVGDRV